MTAPQISIVIVNWNGADCLPACLESVRKQTWTDYESVLIDNASTDGSLATAEKNFPDLKIIRNRENLGFARAANQGIEQGRGEFVFLLNPDVVLEPDYLERLMERALKNETLGALGGKLLRPIKDGITTSMIDSAGLTLLAQKRRPWDRGSDQPDAGQYDDAEDVMGINGAAVLYRRAMLEDVKLDGEYFDVGFFIYFEDVDLALRALLRGWKNFYVPRARARHARGGTGGSRPPGVKVHAAKNRYLVYLKNEPFEAFSKNWIRTLGVELMRLGAYAVREPLSLLGFLAFLRCLPTYCKKRNRIQETANIGADEYLRWYRD